MLQNQTVWQYGRARGDWQGIQMTTRSAKSMKACYAPSWWVEEANLLLGQSVPQLSKDGGFWGMRKAIEQVWAAFHVVLPCEH